MRTIGLTGGIATGKSSVAAILCQDFAVPTVDADVVAREVLAPNHPVLLDVLNHFGTGLLCTDGTLNRAALRAIIANDASKRAALNQLTHPAIHQLISKRLGRLASEGHECAIVEAALMIETGSYKHYSALIVVSCSKEIQRQRVMDRDSQTQEQADRFIATQWTMARKERLATVVIRNNSTLGALRAATHQGWSALFSNEAGS
jgi:dephospho-CoA kinase